MYNTSHTYYSIGYQFGGASEDPHIICVDLMGEKMTVDMISSCLKYHTIMIICTQFQSR